MINSPCIPADKTLIPIFSQYGKFNFNTYFQGLSDYEIMCKVVEYVNMLNSCVVEIKNEIELIKQKSVEQDKAIGDLGKNLRLEIANAENRLNKKILEIQNTLVKVFSLINGNYDYLLDRINKISPELKYWVNMELAKFKKEIENIPLPAVLNPLSGKLEPVQNVFMDFYQYLRFWCVDCEDFDELALTSEEIDKLGLNAYEFDLYSGYILFKHKWFEMRNPFTGEMVDTREVVNMLAELHQSVFTVDVFEELMLTADDYDNLQMTAYEFSFDNPLAV